MCEIEKDIITCRGCDQLNEVNDNGYCQGCQDLSELPEEDDIDICDEPKIEEEPEEEDHE